MVGSTALDDVASVRGEGVPKFDGLAGTRLFVEVDGQLFKKLLINQFFRKGIHRPDGITDIVGVLVVVHVRVADDMRADQLQLRSPGRGDLGGPLCDGIVRTLRIRGDDLRQEIAAGDPALCDVHDHPRTGGIDRRLPVGIQQLVVADEVQPVQAFVPGQHLDALLVQDRALETQVLSCQHPDAAVGCQLGVAELQGIGPDDGHVLRQVQEGVRPQALPAVGHVTGDDGVFGNLIFEVIVHSGWDWY